MGPRNRVPRGGDLGAAQPAKAVDAKGSCNSDVRGVPLASAALGAGGYRSARGADQWRVVGDQESRLSAGLGANPLAASSHANPRPRANHCSDGTQGGRQDKPATGGPLEKILGTMSGLDTLVRP
jgi:hypothetical protein